MRFVEFTEAGGSAVPINAAGALFLRPAVAGGTLLQLAGHGEALHLSEPPDDVARKLEESVPEPPTDPSLALVS